MYTYKNGNTIVGIDDDGTKIRYIPDNQKAKPDYPESIDLKITNRCLMNCAVCHELSDSQGAHGNLNHPLFDSLKPYTELAIGGGDPMSHPDLESFLWRMKRKNVICNLTVHWKQFETNYKTLNMWEREGLIHGLGVSVNEIIPSVILDKMVGFPNLVIHSIIGVVDKYALSTFADKNLNILLLGYKVFGRGVDYYFSHQAQINDKIDEISDKIHQFIYRYRAVSFDNLAIKQLELEKKLTDNAWKQFYMGDDGTFTMYIDLVNNKYAASSTRVTRYDIDSNNINELFAKIKYK